MGLLGSLLIFRVDQGRHAEQTGHAFGASSLINAKDQQALGGPKLSKVKNLAPEAARGRPQYPDFGRRGRPLWMLASRLRMDVPDVRACQGVDQPKLLKSMALPPRGLIRPRLTSKPDDPG